MKAQPNNMFVENPEPQAFLPLSKENSRIERNIKLIILRFT